MGIKKNFVFNILLTGSNLLFPFFTFPYLTRIIGAEGLGICNFIISYSQNFTIVAALGIPAYGIREIARVQKDKEKLSKLFIELLSIHALLTLFALLVYFVSIFLYTDFENYRQLTLAGGMLVFLNIFTVEWLFIGVSDFKYITIRSLIIRTLSVLSIFLLVKHKDDYDIYFFITVVTLLSTAIINISYARKYLSRKIKFSIKQSFIHIKPVTLLGIYIVLTSLYSVLPTTMLGFLSSKVAVGYYYSANKIILMAISVFSALSVVMIPRLNLSFESKDSADYALLIGKALNIIISFGIPITFLVYFLSEPIIMLLAGKEFVNSIICLKFLAPNIVLVAFAQVFVQMILFINRRDKEMVALGALGLVISLVINIFFIPLYAEQAAALSNLFSEVLVVLFSFFIAKKYYNFHFPFKLMLFNTLFAASFALIIFFIFKMTNIIVLQIGVSAILCGFYFMFYQLYILKDKLITETLIQVSTKLNKLIFRNKL